MQSASELLSRGYFWAFLTVFVGGFLTSLTPCVYPMISITVSVFGAKDEKVTRARALLLASSYVGGICVMYTGLGIASALAGRFAFGSLLGNPWVMVPIALLLAVMAASMFGAFELALPTGLQTRLSGVGGKGFVGAFLMGLVGGIIAAPCTGPVLASVLAYVATTRSVTVGGSLLFTYALGMGVLFFVVSVFAQRLPKSGAWMEAVKSVFGVVMVVAALYFLRPVVSPLMAYARGTHLWLMIHLALVGAGLALGGVHLSFHDGWAARLRKGAGIAAIVVGGFGVVGYVLTPKVAEAQKELEWIKGEQPGLAAARSGHRPALLDFYADWCLPCREMEVKTFNQPDVARELGRFTLIKMDTTHDDDPQVIDAKERYHAATLPTVVLLDADGKTAATFNKAVEPGELLPVLKKIPGPLREAQGGLR
jgi:thiol:disulfide interchange protein DsbD